MFMKMKEKFAMWLVTKIDAWFAKEGYHVVVQAFRSNDYPDVIYVGTMNHSAWLRVHGIKPEAIDADHKVASIGYSSREKKWYGWSHRVIFAFGVGSKVTSEDHLCATSGLVEEYEKEHPEEDHSLPVGFEAWNLDDAKRMAIAFAYAVS